MKTGFLLFTFIIFNNLVLCQYDISPYRQKNPSYYELEKKRITEAYIRNLSIIRLNFTNEEILEDSILWQYYEYDKKGNTIFFELFSESTGESDGFLKMTYDLFDNEIISVNYDYINSSFKMTDSSVMVYDEFNRLHFIFRYNRDHNLEDIGYDVYDNNGNMLYSEFAAINQTHFSRERFFYSNDNKLEYTIRTHKNIGSTQVRIDTSYNNTKINDKLKVKYNEKGNILEWVDNTYTRDITVFRFKFDSNDNVIEKERFENDKLLYKIAYKYNNFELKDREIQYDANGNITEETLYIYGFE